MTDHDLQRIITSAGEAMRNAYAPYSDYMVGAALLDDEGRIFSGCNVENASYGLSICAERSAIFQAVASGSRRFKAIAIVSSDDPPARPCGACRQVLFEFCGADLPVYVVEHGSNDVASYSLAELLPNAFGGGFCGES